MSDLESAKACSKCGESPRRAPGQRWCLRCHADYTAANRPGYSELTEEERRRSNARAYLRVYVRRGKVRKPKTCQRCGRIDRPLEGHHSDYSKPLEVAWLCRPCHGLRHG